MSRSAEEQKRSGVFLAPSGGRADSRTGRDDWLVRWEEIRDIELVIRRRMKEFAVGGHSSVFRGTGLDLVGLRDWEPGDRLSSIDWPQSTLTNFSPMVTREFERESNAPVVIAADTSRSTRCGVNGVSIASVIARAVATFGLAAAFMQDLVGLITFDRASRYMAVRPRLGKNHAIHCLEAYQDHVLGRASPNDDIPGVNFAGLLRRQSLVPVISDFLFEDTEAVVSELAELNSMHDVFLVMIDSAFAFELPPISAGWIEGYDVETGRSCVISAGDLKSMSRRVREWQDGVEHRGHERGLEVLRVGAEGERFHDTLVEFLAQRKQRRRP